MDGVSSIGALDFQFDKWKVDVAVTGSQKGLSLPTGLGIVMASKKVLSGFWQLAVRFWALRSCPSYVIVTRLLIVHQFDNLKADVAVTIPEGPQPAHRPGHCHGLQEDTSQCSERCVNMRRNNTHQPYVDFAKV